MPKFNLEDYETVKERKKRFYTDHPNGRIVVEQINNDASVLDYAEFKAYVYLTPEDQEKGLPRGTGHALELREKNKSISSKGMEYEGVNFTSWTENAEESAVGRALDNSGYASAPSKEEMKKVIRHTEILSQETPKKLNPLETPVKRFSSGEVRDTLGHVACNDCGSGISRAVEKFSMANYTRALCFSCQKKYVKSTESD